MKELFSTTGEKILESLTFTKTLYAFDFDGTLAPIVSSPNAAKASAQTEDLLSELASLVPVAVVSGRSIADLKSRLKTPIKNLIGNHGLEGLAARKEAIQFAKSTCEQWDKQVKKHWGNLSKDSGVNIENKTYSLALHYRRSRNKKRARTDLFNLIQELRPAPRVILGKCVINLVPAGGPHKGVALLEMMMEINIKCALYIGDDDTDEDVFSLPDSRIITVRVGQKKSSQAQFFLKRQSEMNRLIRKLIKLNKDAG